MNEQQLLDNSSHKKTSKLKQILGRYRFGPQLNHILMTFVALSILISLGMWQLRRAEYKHALVKQYNQMRHNPPLHLNLVNQHLQQSSLSKLRYANLSVTGQFDTKRVMLLDNKFYEHKVGYDVLVPFIAEQGTKVLLVNRGWVSMGKSRNTLPMIKTINSTLTLQGIIDIPVDKPFMLTASPIPNDISWPLRIQAIDLKKLSKVAGLKFYPFVLRVDANSTASFPSNWKPVEIKPSKHIGYAVQWFALAAVLLIIFLVLNIKPINREDN